VLRDIRFLLKTHYSNSRALVIGINDYALAPPLSYAVSDAEGVRQALVDELHFPTGNVVCLFDHEATKTAILREYMSFASDDVGLDERLVVFFAGHGHTRSGFRGDIGYLVPFDGNAEDLSTMIKWEEFTGNSELIRAKHALFIMDACYGGLALTRAAAPGSTRFLKDMLLRYSRQVLTAGKADEVVSDSGGPIAGHSVFTGHLIEGLQGAAAGEGGVLTASGLMSYVYGKVATDKNSRQTPHFGHFDGDGDMILVAPNLDEMQAEADKDVDELIVVQVAEDERTPDTKQAKIRKVKQLVAGEATSIELHDFVMEEVQALLAATSDDYFPTGGEYSDDELLDRIGRYEAAVEDLAVMLACVAYWARPANRTLVRKALVRSADRFEIQGGRGAWLALRWYPSVYEFYAAGIAAVHADQYEVLADMFMSPFGVTRRGESRVPLILGMSDAILDLAQAEAFKRIPEHERYRTPMSEYLLKVLQPDMDDSLYLGKDYERAFDDFEILMALCTADGNLQAGRNPWGNVGRFGWKEQHGEGPLSALIDRAVAAGEDWEVLRSGLFGGSIERFQAAATPYLDSVKGLGWW
jgi:uncharacterized caspase-like protein